MTRINPYYIHLCISPCTNRYKSLHWVERTRQQRLYNQKAFKIRWHPFYNFEPHKETQQLFVPFSPPDKLSL